MSRDIGLWIDHKRAVIVTVSESGETTQRMDSNLEKRVRYAFSRPGRNAKPHETSSEDGRDRRYNEHLNQYYDKVIKQLQDATDVLILGPGEAKTELQDRLQKDSTFKALVVVKSADKLTEAQIVAEVREYFQSLRAKPQKHTSD